MDSIPEPGIRISVLHGDVLRFRADVLVLKYAQEFYGADRAAASLLHNAGVSLKPLPRQGGSLLVHALGAVDATQVLFVGVEWLGSFRYLELRAFGRNSLEVLAKKAPSARTVCMTPHGANYGLDEAEAFRSQVAGLLDAIQSGDFPPNLASITVLERDGERAETLQKLLCELVPDGIIDTDVMHQRAKLSAPARESLRSAGFESESKPNIFVAMPFAREFNAVYRYGILKPAQDAGYLCERADLTPYTGSVMQWIKSRISRADLVIADLTGKSASVYLEVGFAWGCGKPTVLLVSSADELGFDVRDQRCLVYEGDITLLEELVRTELAGLAKR